LHSTGEHTSSRNDVELAYRPKARPQVTKRLARSSNDDDDDEGHNLILSDEEAGDLGSDSYEDDSDEESNASSASSDSSDSSELDSDEISLLDDSNSSVDNSPAKKDSGSNQRAATTEDITDVKRRALEALDGRTFTNLPTFSTILDRSSDIQIVFATESCLFVDETDKTRFQLRDEWTEVSRNTAHNRRFNNMVEDLQAKMGRRSRISMRGQPSAIDEALWWLYNGDRSDGLATSLPIFSAATKVAMSSAC
jgi:hypothetical protein